MKRKVVVVGAGAVGSTFCYALAQSGLADEIVLMDKNSDLLNGQLLDLAHGQPYMPSVTFRAGTPEEYADARVIVVTAGAAQKPGQSRLELIKQNAAIVGSIAADVAAQNSRGVMLIVSNPVDVLTYVALKRSGWDRRRVIGSGTVLDSARFRHLLGEHCGVDVHNVHAYMLGEHGDSEFAAWSMTHIAGVQIEDYSPLRRHFDNWTEEKKDIEQRVRDSAYHIIGYKGATWFAVGLALVRIVGAILRAERSVLTVSTFLDGEFGLRDVSLSVPCIVSDNGVEQILESPLTQGEHASLQKSAAILKSVLGEMSAVA